MLLCSGGGKSPTVLPNGPLGLPMNQKKKKNQTFQSNLSAFSSLRADKDIYADASQDMLKLNLNGLQLDLTKICFGEPKLYAMITSPLLLKEM
jgi:hypothetical protein